MDYRGKTAAWPRYDVDGKGTPGSPAKFALISREAVRAFEAVAIAVSPEAADAGLAVYYEINGL